MQDMKRFETILGIQQSARVSRSGRTSAKVEATFHVVSWFVAL